MKKITLFNLLIPAILLLSLPAFSQKLVFGYDQSGNQSSRNWVCVNCRPAAATAAAPETAALKVEVKKLDSAKNMIVKRTITASPNPFLEDLHIDWQVEQGISVKDVFVFSISGSRTHHVTPAPGQQRITLPFQRLATGTYIVYITFSDNRKESIKVIKR